MIGDDSANKTIRLDQLRVMVIDDNRDMRALIKSLLHPMTIKDVVECSDGVEAFEELRVRTADIIFTDWDNEPIDGIEFLKLLRRSPDSPCPRANVILVSSHVTAEHVVTARNAGMTEFLAKPLSAESLRTRVMSVLEHPRPFIQSAKYVGPCRRRRFPGGYDGPERRKADEYVFEQEAAPPGRLLSCNRWRSNFPCICLEKEDLHSHGKPLDP